MRGLLPLWVGAGVYAVFILAGNHLLIDPDTMWQITIGQWIVDHGAVPTTDVYSFTMRGQPWISTQWLAQVAYAEVFAFAGWTGPVVLASALHRRDLRAVHAVSGAALEREHDPGIRRGGAGAGRAASAGAAACAGAAGDDGVGRRTGAGRGSPRRAVVLAAAADGAVGQSAWRFCPWPRIGGADRARCGVECGRRAAQIAGTALGRIRRRGDRCELRDALWLEFAAGVAKNSRARRSAAADHGMAAGGFLRSRPAGSLPAARLRPRAVSRHLAAAAAHRAAARHAAHGAEPDPQPGNFCVAGAAVSRRPAGKADRRRR